MEVNPPIDLGSLPMRFKVLKRFTKGTTTGETFPVPDKYWLPYRYYIIARFYEDQVAEKIDQTGPVTTNATFLPGPAVINVAQYYYDKAQETATRIAPKLPPIPIKKVIHGKLL